MTFLAAAGSAEAAWTGCGATISRLPTTSRVIGFRLYQGGTGKALVVPCNFPGTAGPTDQANMAMADILRDFSWLGQLRIFGSAACTCRAVGCFI